LAGLGNTHPDGFLFASTRGEPYLATSQIDPVSFTNFVTVGDDGLIDYRDFNLPFSSQNSLWQLASATLAFESSHMHLPTQSISADDGTPLLSWRVAILPFLGEGKTVYLGLNGEGTLFDSENAEIGLGRIGDGLTNTILFVEADVSQAVEWSRPVDLNYDAADPTRGLGGISADGTFTAVLADASVVRFDLSAPELLNTWTTFNGGEVNNETVLANDFSRFRTVENQLRQPRRSRRATVKLASCNSSLHRTAKSL